MIYKTNETNGTQEYVGDKYLLSMSGGKDSTAMFLHFKESLIDPDLVEYIFMDTGWEHKETYDYLCYLEDRFDIKINKIRQKIEVHEEYKPLYDECLKILNRDHSDFVARAINYAFFPSRRFKWCTTELKIWPLKNYIKDSEYELINCVGVRRLESKKRSQLEMWEYNDGFNVWFHRPLIDWTEQQVIDIHKRHDIKPNPLYLVGHNRVGCYPCVNSNKADIKALDKTHPHIEVIRFLESEFKKRKGKERAFFTDDVVDNMIDWSRTSYGGKQYSLFNTEEPTCQKWGMCGI